MAAPREKRVGRSWTEKKKAHREPLEKKSAFLREVFHSPPVSPRGESLSGESERWKFHVQRGRVVSCFSLEKEEVEK